MKNRLPRILATAALATLTTLALVAPASAELAPGCRLIRGAATVDDPTDDVQVCRQDVWLAKSSVPIGNAIATGQAAAPSWDTSAPTGALQDGGAYAGSSEADIFVAKADPAIRPTFQGSFTGTLDTLGFTLFLRDAFNEVNGGSLGAMVYLEIDGQVVSDNYDTAAIDLPMTPAGDLFRVKGAFTNLYGFMQDNGMDLSPTAVHTVKLGVVGWFFPASETVFFYDSAPAPSGLVFNVESTSGAVKIDVQGG